MISVNKTRVTLPYLLLAALVIFTPLLMTLLLIHGVFGASLLDLKPTSSDEILYWQQTNTMVHTGLNGGYFTWVEITGPIPFLRFHAWGSMIIAVFSSFGSIFGWQLASGALFNITSITLALAFFIFQTRLETPRLGLLGLLLLVFWPIMLFIPISMQEALHLAIALVLAPLFYHMIRKDSVLTRREYWTLFVVIFVAAVIKPYWSSLFVPFFLLTSPQTWKHRLLALMKAGIAAVIPFVLLSLTSSTSLYFLPLIITRASTDPGTRLMVWIAYIWDNLTSLITLTPVEFVQFGTMIALIVVFGLLVSKETDSIRSKEIIFHLCNLGISLAFVILVHFVDAFRGTRATSPNLLLSLLLLLLLRRDRLLMLALTAHLVVAPAFLPLYQSTILERTEFNNPGFAQQIAPVLRYNPNASTPWCNTLVHNYYDSELMYLPAGIGLTFIPYWGAVTPPFKSQYILLADERFPLSEPKLHVEPLVETDVGTLYLNLDSECIDAQQNNP